MTRSESGDKGFYEKRGMVRHMIIVPPEHKEKLKILAKQYQITQGEIVELLLEHLDEDKMSSVFEDRHIQKKGQRPSKTLLIKQIRDMSPEQLAAIQKAISAGE